MASRFSEVRPRLVAVVDHRFADLSAERSILAKVGAELVDLRGASDDEVIEACADAEGILLGARFQFTRERIARLGRCRVIARYGVGFDNVDVAAADEMGIAVTFVPDYCVEEVANHAMTLLLALHRHLIDFDARLRGGNPGIPAEFVVPRLSGCTLGVLGFGRIGAEVGRRARAFGLRIAAYDPYLPEGTILAAGAVPVSLEEAIGESEFVSLHFPLNNSTRHVIDAAAIARMRPGAFIINVARGGLVDEEALADAIRSGRLGGAGLDVTEIEPLPADNPLRTLPGVILTPHVAWLSTGAREELQVKTAEEAVRVLRGEPARHQAHLTH